MLYNTFTMSTQKRTKTEPLSRTPKTYGYCRVSTRQQADEGHSLDDQQFRISGYCQANGLPTPADYFVDAATSGTISLHRREAGKRLLYSVECGDHIVVTKGDRLFRSAKNALDVADLLRQRGVELHLMDMGGPVLNSSVSRLVFGILMMVANMEAERIGERTASVKETMRKQGRFVGGLVPVGYEKTADGRLVVSPEWKEQRATIQVLHQEGLSTRKIAETMTDRGLPISHMTVYNVLTHARKVDEAVTS